MSRSKDFGALIFDCDGVLVNSEEIVERIEREHLASIGLVYGQTEFVSRFLGLTVDAFHAELSRDAQILRIEPPTEHFYTTMRQAIRTTYTTALQALPGVTALVQRWPAQQAVASSSETTSLAHKLNLTGLAEFFSPHIYSADLVAAGKPDPAIFRYAATQLDVAPTHCLAIEDSVNGVVSAKAAGMTTLGYVGGRHCPPQQSQLLMDNGADAVFNNYASLLEWLGLT